MKQLKFMLAAATAVGLAAAAQAASLSNTPLVNDTFDGATLPAGYSYDGDVEADNESAVKDGVLEVNTGTDPLLRALDFGDSARDINLADEKFDSLVIDTMVQFTVTPAGDEVKPSKDADGNILDKIMIYLAEATNETGVVIGTNLMVKAAKYTPATTRPQAPAVFEESDVVASGVSVVPGAWYHLVVTSKKHEDGFAQFKIQLAAEGGELVPLTNSEGLINTDNTLFPSLTGIDGVNPTTLTYVGFAGEGKVDDLKVNLFELATSVDFTLALGDGVNAVTWTINEAEKSGEGSASFAAGTTIVVSIDSVTYDAGYAGTEDWTAWTYNKAESGSIKITAEKFAEVSDTGVVTPTEATIEAVTGGSFKVPAVGGDVTAEEVAEATANLGKALTWATASGKGGKSYTAAIEAINTMNFVDDNETTTEQAYLLDCSTGELGGENGEIAKFKFAGFDLVNGFTVGADPTKQAADGGAYGNGFVEVRGSATINGAYNEAADTAKHNFFKAFLVPFAPVK